MNPLKHCIEAERRYLDDQFPVSEFTPRSRRVRMTVSVTLRYLPCLYLCALAGFTVGDVHAQSVSDQTLGNALKSVRTWANGAIEVLGILFGFAAAAAKGMNKNWEGPAVGSAACFFVDACVLLFRSWGRGKEVNFDSGLGN